MFTNFNLVYHFSCKFYPFPFLVYSVEINFYFYHGHDNIQFNLNFYTFWLFIFQKYLKEHQKNLHKPFLKHCKHVQYLLCKYFFSKLILLIISCNKTFYFSEKFYYGYKLIFYQQK